MIVDFQRTKLFQRIHSRNLTNRYWKWPVKFRGVVLSMDYSGSGIRCIGTILNPPNEGKDYTWNKISGKKNCQNWVILYPTDPTRDVGSWKHHLLLLWLQWLWLVAIRNPSISVMPISGETIQCLRQRVTECDENKTSGKNWRSGALVVNRLSFELTCNFYCNV